MMWREHTPDLVPLVEAMPTGRWHVIDRGHHTARIGTDHANPAVKRAATELWGLFDRAATGLGIDPKSLVWLEVTALKRQTESGQCPAHRDTDYVFNRGRVLSLSFGLSEIGAYQGGGLKVASHPGVRLGRGDAAVFPSAARHQVHPVTSGERITLVARVLTGNGHAAGQWLIGRDLKGRRCGQVTEREYRMWQRARNRRPATKGTS